MGYPIWNGDLPMAVYTFLEDHDWSGKTVIPFNTHGGSGQAGTVSSIRTACSCATVESGIAITGTTAQNDRQNTRQTVNAWLETMGFATQTGNAESSAVSGEAAGQFDLESGTVLLNSGYEMPILGLGTFRLSDSECENSVYHALLYGGRLIDTARIYGNEAAVGRAIRRAIDEGICTREEIFVTTKMWTSDFDNGDAAIDASLERLGLDYIDLMILHHSQPSNDVTAYQAMERAVEAGKLRSIGLSNYYTPEDFDRLVNATTIAPALLQNETHLYHQSVEMKEHIAQYGTVMESWFPLGGRGQTQILFNDPTVVSIAEAHDKTSAQIILRWHLQAGNIAIPGSSNPDHILENLSIYDFALTDAEMDRLTALDRNERFADY
nr:aldo/keto reductase [Intestinimonas butyriciproducens]